MNFWKFLDSNPCYAIALWITLIVLMVFIGVVIWHITRRFTLIWKWYQEAKNESDFDTISKNIKTQLKKKKHAIVFASSVRDNNPDYKEAKRVFAKDDEILEIDKFDIGNFDEKLNRFNIIVYHVSACDVVKSDFYNKSIYVALAEYCSTQKKHCILVTPPSLRLRPDVLDNNVYVTTVNFYSKLRETLFILLYFTSYKS